MKLFLIPCLLLVMVLVFPKPAKTFHLPEEELVSYHPSTECDFGCQPDYFCQDRMCFPGPNVERNEKGWYKCGYDRERPKYCSPAQSCVGGRCVFF